MENFLVRIPKKRKTLSGSGHANGSGEVVNEGTDGGNGDRNERNSSKFAKKILSSTNARQSYLEFGSSKRLGRVEICRICDMTFIQDNEEDCKRHESHCKLTKELKLRSIRVGDILEQNEENGISIVQISIAELVSKQKSLVTYMKAVTRMFEELGGCIDELNDNTLSNNCYALFHVDHLNIIAVIIVELVTIRNLSLQTTTTTTTTTTAAAAAAATTAGAEEEKEKEEEPLTHTTSSNSASPAACPPDPTDRQPHICVSTGCEICPGTTIGIRQMWVRADKRGQGIIFTLIEMARKRTYQRLLISRRHIAFSQPTFEGKKFILRYLNSPVYWIYSH